MIESLSDLRKLLKLCREQGVDEIDVHGVKLKFGDMPTVMSKGMSDAELESKDPYANFPQGELTPEQLMFYSAGGHPEEDPALKVIA